MTTPAYTGTPFDPEQERSPWGQYGREPGMSPKYTRATGGREHDFVESLARLYVPVPAGRTRRQMIDSVVAESDPEAAPLVEAVTGNGYVDFQLTAATHTFSEKMDVTETLADNYVAYFFGQNAPTFNYQGFLVNSIQDDQVAKMYLLYRDLLRGVQLARKKTLVRLRYDGMIVSGAFFGLSWTLTSDNEVYVPFSFNLLVKKITLLPRPAEAGVTSLEEGFTPEGVETLGFSGAFQEVVREVRTAAIPKAPPQTQRSSAAKEKEKPKKLDMQKRLSEDVARVSRTSEEQLRSQTVLVRPGVGGA